MHEPRLSHIAALRQYLWRAMFCAAIMSCAACSI